MKKNKNGEAAASPSDYILPKTNPNTKNQIITKTIIHRYINLASQLRELRSSERGT